MTLLRTSALSAIATLVRIGAGFVINKIVAVYAGPGGLALVGQFQNFVTVVQTFANGGISAGIVKYTAEYRDDALRRSRMLGTALAIGIACGLTVSLVLALNSEWLSRAILKTDRFSGVLAAFAVTLTFFVLNDLMLSILNGRKEVGRYVAINILSSLTSVALTLALVDRLHLFGALLSLALLQSLVFFITLALFAGSSSFRAGDWRPAFDRASLSQLRGFSLMAMTSALAGPVSQMLVRDHLIGAVSAEAAGYWQGVWRISDGYLTLFTASIGVYYLPRIAEIRDHRELRAEVMQGYRIVLPAVACVAAAIYLLRETIIRVLYSDAFLPASGLFAFQLLGDCLKIASWLLSYIMVGRAMVKPYIATELLFAGSFVLLAIFFVNRFGVVGATYAYALNYALYLAAMCWLFRRLLRGFSRPGG